MEDSLIAVEVWGKNEMIEIVGSLNGLFNELSLPGTH